jgi:hypothetical protein
MIQSFLFFSTINSKNIMGRQVGLVHLSGQFGDVRASVGPDGKGYVAFAPPISAKRVKEDKNYELTRRVNDEFIGSVRAAQSVRQCMGERIAEFGDRHLTSRLNALCKKVINTGPGFFGERRFEVVPNLGLFRHVEANKRERLRSRFMAPFSVTVNTDRNVATLDVASFLPNNFIHAPSGATDCRLTLVAGVLSDFVFTGDNDVYAPAEPTLDGITVSVPSALIPVSGSGVAAFQVIAAIPGAPVLPATTGLAVSVGIEFVKVVNSVEYVMASGNAMQLVEVY